MSDKIPIDGEFGLDYHIHVMRKMIGELPPPLAKPFNEQLDAITQALKNRSDIIRETIGDSLDDARLSVNMLEFDLQATRRERDELQSRLDDLS